MIIYPVLFVSPESYLPYCDIFAYAFPSSCPNMPEYCDGNWAMNQGGPNPQTLYGALVGGPGQVCHSLRISLYNFLSHTYSYTGMLLVFFREKYLIFSPFIVVLSQCPLYNEK